MSTDRILARIGHAGAVRHDVETLRALQGAFLLSVPFENLDIHCGRAFGIEPADVLAKLVGERRGGLCYECNGLFHDLLAGLGFRVRFVSARMAIHGRLGPPFDHMALIVDLDRPWLLDAGNGQSNREPLPLDDPDRIASAEGNDYCVGLWDTGHALYWRPAGAGWWAPRYLFDATAIPRADYAPMARWHQSGAEAPFTRAPLASLALPDGRVTLAGRNLVRTRGAQREERELRSAAEVDAVLRDVFGLELPAPLRAPADA